MSFITKIAVTSLLAAVAILGVACDDNSERASADVTPTGSASGTVAAGKASMPTGVTFVLVRGVEDGSLILDPADLLSGDEAVDAAREDGVLPSDEELPNDFYLRNLERESLIFTVAEDARFTLIGFDASGGLTDIEVDRATFEALLAGGDASAYYGFTPTELPVVVEIQDAGVTGGRQQYLP